MSESKLKRCPFAKCGGQGKSQSNMYYGFWIHCSKCKAMTDYYEDPEEAAVAWNDRTPEPWLPIDTAPKGETRVDLWCGGMLRVTNCRWSDEGNCWENEWGQVLPENLIPTHWMPTPASPKETA